MGKRRRDFYHNVVEDIANKSWIPWAAQDVYSRWFSRGCSNPQVFNHLDCTHHRLGYPLVADWFWGTHTTFSLCCGPPSSFSMMMAVILSEADWTVGRIKPKKHGISDRINVYVLCIDDSWPLKNSSRDSALLLRRVLTFDLNDTNNFIAILRMGYQVILLWLMR